MQLTPRVFVTPALIAVNVAVFVIMVASGVSLFDPTAPVLVQWGANFGPRTTGGEWWRLLTCTFLHIGLIHLALNMWVLWDIGNVVERLVGNVGFFILYVFSGLAGSLASMWWAPAIVSAGASGAIFGVWGAFLGFLLLRRDSIPLEALQPLRNSGIAFVGYNFVFGLMIPNIDMAGHIGGLVFGFAAGLALSHPLTVESLAGRRGRSICLAVIGIVVVVAGISFMPRVDDWLAALENFDKVEPRTIRAVNQLIQQHQQGSLTQQEVAAKMEREVLPEWSAARKKLADAKHVPTARRDFVSGLLNYMKLREEAWELLAVALRDGDPAKMQQANAKSMSADAAAKQLQAKVKAGK